MTTLVKRDSEIAAGASAEFGSDEAVAEVCRHERVIPEVVDQTLGVACLDCKLILRTCWMDDHIPESLWNRACDNEAEAERCVQDRDDYCAICTRLIEPEGLVTRR